MKAIKYSRISVVDSPTDIVFVVDDSASISSTNFTRMKSALSCLVGRLDIDSGNARVGLVKFGSTVSTVFNFTAYTSVATLQAAILSLSQAEGGTNTHTALARVRTTLLTSAAGDRSNVPNIVVVITDGKSSNKEATQVSIKHILHSLLCIDKILIRCDRRTYYRRVQRGLTRPASPSLSFSVGGMSRPWSTKNRSYASSVGRVDVVGGCTCLRVRRAAK